MMMLMIGHLIASPQAASSQSGISKPSCDTMIKYKCSNTIILEIVSIKYDILKLTIIQMNVAHMRVIGVAYMTIGAYIFFNINKSTMMENLVIDSNCSYAWTFDSDKVTHIHTKTVLVTVKCLTSLDRKYLAELPHEYYSQ